MLREAPVDSDPLSLRVAAAIQVAAVARLGTRMSSSATSLGKTPSVTECVLATTPDSMVRARSKRPYAISAVLLQRETP
jgi:hypothetical protein